MKKLSKSGIRIVLWPTTDGVLWCHDQVEEIALIGKKLAISSNDTYFLHDQFKNAITKIREETKQQPLTKKLIIKKLEESLTILKAYNITGKKFLDIWIDTNVTIVNTDALVCMSMLHYKGIKNIIISDWLKKSEMNLLKKYKFYQYVDKIYASDNFYQPNHPKAMSSIIKFDKKDQYCIVGTSLKKDISFGNTAEITSVWYNPDGLANMSKIHPTYTISSLYSLQNLII